MPSIVEFGAGGYPVDRVVDSVCVCGGRRFAVLYDDEVRWVTVGLSCVQDAVAGVHVDWKIDYSPSAQLLGAT